MRALKPWLRQLFLATLLISMNVWGFALTHYGQAGFDAPILLWFRVDGETARLAGPEWITNFWLSLTWLGDTVPRIVVAVITILGLLYFRNWRNALFITWVLLSGIALSTALKHWIGRPRPKLVPYLDHISSMSFPSGHAFNSTLFYLTIVMAIAPLLASRSLRFSLYTLALTLSVATGVSRIALGVHWPSDVLAGWIMAVAWAFLWLDVAKHKWPNALI